ncbi:FCD domain-containing protein [Amaricoccus solimangrovi]|uniref:Pyruvate dehydrogenase complex repressor n=1 Tax=Amaricoccus solimangrovi TaxID=2589815 RepID=A0A501WK22_9RHOB|nr:FCD domain-containing protein [Amaricoccus solimangrovi]TPE49859.1 FCD domain-containing protein [Amaricoccus solimangrovi]
MARDGIKGIGAAESTARHIEDLILEGSLRPGEPLLPEREMALRLNVSRPTLRQGMKLLEERGLLVAEPGGARVVAPLATSITDPLIELMSSRGEVVNDYLELRGTLEGMAATLAATRANDVDRDTLRRCAERIDAAHAKADPHDEADADVDLHVAIYEASHNVVLLQIMRALSGMLRRGVFHNREKLYARPEVREVLLTQHRAIFDAVMARDPAAAGGAAEEHMAYTRRVLAEIAAAEARLEISLRRIDGGSLSSRARTRPATGAG